MTESRRVRRRIIRSWVEGRGWSGGRVFVWFGEVLGGGTGGFTGVRDGDSVLPLYLHAIEQIGEWSLSFPDLFMGSELMKLTLLLFPLPHLFDQLLSFIEAGVSSD